MTDTPEQRLIVSLETRLSEYEKMIAEQFKPALLEAVTDVLTQIAGDFAEEALKIRQSVEQASE